LKSYFILATVEDKIKSAELILEYLNNSIKAYFLNIHYIFKIILMYQRREKFRNFYNKITVNIT